MMGVDYTISPGLSGVKTPFLDGFFQRNAFQNQLELRPAERLFFTGLHREVELPRFQTFHPDTVATAVKVQDLHPVALAIEKHKQVPAEWIFSQMMLRQGD